MSVPILTTTGPHRFTKWPQAEYWTILFSRSQIRSRSFVQILSQIRSRSYFFQLFWKWATIRSWSRSYHFPIIPTNQILDIANNFDVGKIWEEQKVSLNFPKEFFTTKHAFLCINFLRCQIFSENFSKIFFECTKIGLYLSQKWSNNDLI